MIKSTIHQVPEALLWDLYFVVTIDYCGLTITLKTINLTGVELAYIIFHAKASRVAKDLVYSIDGRNHTVEVNMMEILSRTGLS